MKGDDDDDDDDDDDHVPFCTLCIWHAAWLLQLNKFILLRDLWF